MAPTPNGGVQSSSKRDLAKSWSEKDIISVFKQTPQEKPNGSAVTGFLYPPQQPVAYVKFGDTRLPPDRKAELRNHEWAFQALRRMPPDQTRGIRIPEVYRSFESDNIFFIVMEYVPGRTLAQIVNQKGWESQQATLANKIARATRLLMSIPAPPNQTPGPVGGGFIRHPLFKDDTSYYRYSSVDELEKHVNKVSTLRKKDSPTVRLERNLSFYFSDFFAGNFIFTDSGDICLIDFDQAGFLPQSFMMYAMAESHWFPGLWIKEMLKLPEDNLKAMQNIHYWFAIGVPWLGESGIRCPLYNLMSEVANITSVVQGLTKEQRYSAA